MNPELEVKVEQSRQFLSFQLAGEEYAIDILKVQEIRDSAIPTLIPNSPSYIEGVLNLRGEIIPVINLRNRIGLPTHSNPINRIVIVLNITSGSKSRLMGLLVDAFSETYDVPISAIKPAPAGISVIDDEFIIGLTTANDRMLILLDADALLNSNELSLTINQEIA